MSLETYEKAPMIVLSGGPCAGKTTALSRIVSWCQERGFHPLIVPEAATELIASGFDPSLGSNFQYRVLEDILHREELRRAEASTGLYQNPVLICDRGRMDGQAYVDSAEAFEKILSQKGLTLTEARDIYSGVIFLDSAACGAEAFYTLANNNSRSEGLEEARTLNEKTKAAWNGTPHLQVIPNRSNESFDDKMWHCTKALARILGVPEPIECERKFRLDRFNLENLPKEAVAVDIVQTYLINSAPGIAERVRARGQNNSWLYFHTIKEPISAGTSIERDRLISKVEYDDLLVRRDDQAQAIYKKRYCFVHNHQYCELDIFSGHLSGIVLLEMELHHIDQEVEVPTFLGSYTDVTDDSDFSNYAMAHAA